MIDPSTVQTVKEIGIPAVIVLALLWACWKWIPAVAQWFTGIAGWGTGIVDRLTISNEITGKALMELTAMHHKEALVGSALQRGQRLLGMIHLALAENRIDDARRMIRELEELHQQDARQQ